MSTDGPFYEFVSFSPASTLDSVSDALKELASQKGVYYYGTKVEDSKIVGNIVWESQELHQAPKPSGAEAVKQVKFTTPFVKPLQAKITEYAFINTKADHNSDEVETLLDELSVELHKASPHGNSYGPIIGTKADYLLIVGWDSVEHHTESVKDGRARELVLALLDVSAIDLFHVPLTTV